MYIYVALALALPALYLMYGKKTRSSYSFEIGEATPGETIPRRNCISRELIAKPAGCSTLYESFKQVSEDFPHRDCFGIRDIIGTQTKTTVVGGVNRDWVYFEKSPYKWTNYKDSFDRCSQFASGLRAIGIQPGSRLCIYEETRLEWTIAEQACYMQSITVLTVYANLGLEALVYALSQAKVTYILTNGNLLSQLAQVVKTCPTIKHVIFTDKANQQAATAMQDLGITLYSFAEIEKLGSQNPVPHTPPKPEDLACIMYTSGSTGIPKGVMITHGNMISAVGGFGACFSVVDGDTYLNYLPLAHVLAMVVENAVIRYGARMGFGNTKTLTEENMVPGCLGDMRCLAPTAMAGVPLVFDRIKAGIIKKIQQESKLKQIIFQVALVIKKWAFVRGRPTPLLNKVVFDQFKTGLGGKMRFMVSGGAPLSQSCQLFLEACFSVPILQGYGLTETCGAGNVMMMEDRSQGTVGPPVPCVEIKLVDAPEMGYLSKNNCGEVWIRGPAITQGYFLNDELTHQVFTADGWFKTGDIGRWNSNGTLSIVDRIKNLVKGPGGEYIALEKLESVFKNSKYVVNNCVYADKEYPIVISIVQPQPAVIAEYLKANPNGKPGKDNNFLQAIIADLNAAGAKEGLKSFEKVTHVILALEEWTPDNNMLTAAMKLNRKQIYDGFQKQIKAILQANS